MNGKSLPALVMACLVCVCLFVPSAFAQENPTPHLAVGQAITTHTGSVVNVPISFTGNGQRISAMTFALVHDPSRLQLSTPDAVTFHLPNSFSTRAFAQAGQPDTINFSLYTFAQIGVPDGRVVTIPFTAACPEGADPSTQITTTLDFAADPPPGFGNTAGMDVRGVTTGASITIVCRPLPPNRAPDAAQDTATVAEDGSVLIDVLRNDSDADGDAITIAEIGDAAFGDTALIGQQIRYSPGANYHGADFFAYTIADTAGNTSTALVLVTVSPVNDAPLARADNAVTDEETPITVAVLQNDEDVDGDVLAVSITRPPRLGTVTVTGAGDIHYLPNANVNGEDSFVYRIEDGKGGAAEASAVVVIRPVNDAPLAGDDLAATHEDQVLVIPVLKNDGDVDGDGLSIVAVSAPQHGTALIIARSVRYQPAANFHGEDRFTYTIADGAGGEDSATVTLTVLPVNDPPQARDVATVTQEETPVDIVISAVDVEGDALTIDVLDRPSSGSATVVDATTIRYVPHLNFAGEERFRYRVSDGRGGQDVAWVVVDVLPVNDPPSAFDDAAATQAGVPVRIDVLGNDRDVEGDALTIVDVASPSFGSVVQNNDQTLTYTPNMNFSGLDTFVYRVRDAEEGESTATVTVLVMASANNRVVAKDDKVKTAEDSAIVIDVLANDRPRDGSLRLLTVTQPQFGVVSLAGRQVVYTPQPNFSGADVFDYTVGDGAQGMDQARVTVSVRAVNDAPIAADDVATTRQGEWVSVDVLFNDGDVEGDALSIVHFTQPRNGTVRLRQVAGARPLLRYLPNAGFHAEDTFYYRVSDGNGGLATARVVIAVQAVNAAPIAVDDFGYTSEDTPLILYPLANDRDPEGDPLRLIALGAPRRGAVFANGDGSLTYVPRADANGIDSFTYTIADAAAESAAESTAESTARVTILIRAVVDRPHPVADAALTGLSQPVTVAPLLNDIDNDGQGIVITSFGQPAHGVVEASTATNRNRALPAAEVLLTYTPDPGFQGIDSFTYSLSDANGNPGAVDGIITVVVDGQPGALAAQDDTTTTAEDRPIAIAVQNNDLGPVGRIVGVDGAQKGTVAIGANGVLTYTPIADAVGEDRFRYTVVSGATMADQAWVTVNITPVNDPPAAEDDSALVLEDGQIAIPLLQNDSDADGDVLVVVQVGDPRFGRAVIDAANVLTYTPNPNFAGSDVFAYTVFDGHNGYSRALVRVDVVPVDDVPDVADDVITTAEDTAVAVDLLSNDFDRDGRALTVRSLGAANHGAVSLTPEGTVIYTPTANYYGLDTVPYVVHNGVLTATAALQVLVNSVNDAPLAADDVMTIGVYEPIVIDVLKNDVDVDGDPLFILAVGNALGHIEVEDDRLIYELPPAFLGTDVFTYTVSDGLTTHTAQVKVTYSTLAAVSASVHADVVANAIVRPGEWVTYTLRFENTGGVPLTNLVIDGVLGPHVSVRAIDMSWPGGRDAGTELRWRIERLGIGQALVIRLVVEPDADLDAALQFHATLYSDQLLSMEAGALSHLFDPLSALPRLTATQSDTGVQVEWQSTAQTTTSGFHVWRGFSEDRAQSVRLTDAPIPVANGDAPVYRFFDQTETAATARHYWIEEVKVDDYRRWHGPVAAAPPVGTGASETFLPVIASTRDGAQPEVLDVLYLPWVLQFR